MAVRQKGDLTMKFFENQIANKNVPARWVLSFSLDSQMSGALAISVKDWSDANHGIPVRIETNSPGGNPMDALFLFEQIKALQMHHHVTLATNGRGGSCASWLSQAINTHADDSRKARRVIGSDSWLMFHHVRSASKGAPSRFEQEVNRVRQVRTQTVELMTRHTKGALTAAQLLKTIDLGDYWISASEALRLGLVDEVEQEPLFDRLVPEVRPSRFFLCGSVTRESARVLALDLISWSGKHPGKPLRLDINSTGGSHYDGLFLLEQLKTLRRLGHHLTVGVQGRACHTAALLVQAADVRAISSDSWLEFEEEDGDQEGNERDLECENQRVRQCTEQALEIFTRRTNGVLTPAMMHEKLVNGNLWITAQDAKEYGLVDVIE